MAKWLPPNGFTGKVHHMDAKVGGSYKMSFTNFTTGKSHSFGGTYLELVPNERIRYTDKFDDPNLPGEMQVDDHLEEGFVRDRIEHRAGRRARRDPARGVLPRLAGIAHSSGETRRGRDSRLRGTRDQRSEIRDQGSEIRDQRPEIEIRDQRSGDQRSEIRGQRSEVRGKLERGIRLRSEFRQTVGAFDLRRSARRHISLFFPPPPAGRHTLSTS